MRRVLLVAVMFLVPSILVAQPASMGIFFDFVPGLMADYPVAFSPFELYLYLHNSGVYVTAVEYQLLTPSDPTHALLQLSSVGYPEKYSVSLGAPFDGHSITYWPPLDGYSPGYNLICKLTCFITVPCWTEGGSMIEYLIVVGPHPDTGELKGTYYPENLPFPIIGRTSKVCPQEPVAVQEESWGAIKAMLSE